MKRTAAEADHRELPSRFIAPIAFGTILQPLNSSMIAVALVGIRDHFHAGSSVTWLVSALYLATAVAAPAMGRIADLLGPRRTSLGGLALVAAASVAAPFAPGVGTLVACRVVIGIGTAAQYPCGVAMVRHAADRLHARSHSALGAIAVCSQVTAALGPTLGGLLVGGLGWTGIFWVNVPLAVCAAAVILRWGPADPPAAPGEAPAGRLRSLARVDPLGILLFAATIAALMFWLLSLADRPQWWWLAVLAPCAVLAVARGLRARDPFLDVRLLGRRDLSFTYLRTIATYTAFYCVFYGLPQWLEEARGLGPTGAGLVVLPTAVLGAASTFAATRLVRHRGPRVTLLVGTVALLAGGLLLTVPRTGSPVLLLLAVTTVVGLPNGFNNMGNQNTMYAAAPAARTGAASGLYRTSQYVGANLAAAVLALVLGHHADDAGLHRMGLTVAGIAVLLLLTSLAGTVRRAAAPREHRTERHHQWN
ncbi:MFS transporter [Streptacidiphilus griseoplanus]|uniref:MFS transporter n=1 Tax=Peterkaempfera griseoplana TaxID=66896 RepID=UPI0007C6FE0B|nr:MFS transporter [Peterkaempfera griseoplana]